MDCAISALFPATGAPAAPGAETAPGSGAELAALFASLVAGRGVELPPDAGTPPNTGEVSEALGAIPNHDADVAETETAAQVTSMPWWLDVVRQPPLSPDAVPDGPIDSAGSPPGTDAALIDAPFIEPAHLSTTPTPGVAGTEAPAQQARAGGIAIATGPPAEALAESADPAAPVRSEAPVQAASPGDAGDAPPASVATGHAARALARVLAVLDEGAGALREPAAAAAASAAGVPSKPVDTPAVPEGFPAPASRSVDPAAAPRSNAQAAPVATNAFTLREPTSAENGANQGGEGGFARQPGDREPALVAGGRPPVTSETVLDGLLAQQAPPALASAARPGAVPTPAAQTATDLTAQEAAVADQVVQAIRIRAGDGSGEARVRLNPEFLGEVRIELKIAGDRVTAVLHVERDDVRQQIEQGTATLRAALAAQGLNLEELAVYEDGSSRREGSQEDRREPRERKRRREPAQAFEIPD